MHAWMYIYHTVRMCVKGEVRREDGGEKEKENVNGSDGRRAKGNQNK